MKRLSVRWLLFFAALALAAPLSSLAGVYRWVDERGVVNYGDEPPLRARGLVALDPPAATANVIPGIPRDELQRLRERDTRARLQRLEAEVEELRAREAERAAAPPPETTVYSTPVYAYGHGWTRWKRADFGRKHRAPIPISPPSVLEVVTMPGVQAPIRGGPPRLPRRGLEPALPR